MKKSWNLLKDANDLDIDNCFIHNGIQWLRHASLLTGRYGRQFSNFEVFVQLKIYLLPNFLSSKFSNKCFAHPIFLSFGFWYFGHFSYVIFFPVFFHLAHLALQNVNKYYVIFSYFCNFVAKSDQKPKTKNGMKKTKVG